MRNDNEIKVQLLKGRLEACRNTQRALDKQRKNEMIRAANRVISKFDRLMCPLFKEDQELRNEINKLEKL